MSGLFFIGVMALWLWFVLLISKLVVKRIEASWLKWSGAAIIFVALLIGPIGDEIVGKHQFEDLCKANDIGGVDVSAAKGKTVVVHYGERYYVPRTWVPIKESDVIFTDVSTGEILIQHKNYYAEGGWLRRKTFFGFGSNTPMLFSGNGCGFEKRREIFSLNSIIQQ